MAKVSLETIEKFSNNAQDKNRVGFFTLKNDGEESVVRFLVDSMDDMDILTVHEVQAGGKYLKVSCNRELDESPDKCPLCASGSKLVQKVYIKMLQYGTDETGNIVCFPVIWERSPQYAIKLREYLNNYGPLSDIICKVVRHGGKGDLKTTYEIIPNLNKMIYPDSKFVKDTSAFVGYKVLGSLVKEKTADEMRTFLATGQFPMNQTIQNDVDIQVVQNQAPNYQSSGYVPAQQGYTFSGPGNDFTSVNTQSYPQNDAVKTSVTQAVPQVPVQAVPQQRMPWQQSQQVQRPIRTY